MKKLIVGLGNPILGDDGVGWVVAEGVRKELASLPASLLGGEGSIIEVDCLSLGGIGLMERMIGYEGVILVDALRLDVEPGCIIVSMLDELPHDTSFHLTSAHDMSLQNAMVLGRQLGVELPENVVVVGVSASQIYDFSEELSPSVQEAVPKMTQLVVELLMQNITIHEEENQPPV